MTEQKTKNAQSKLPQQLYHENGKSDARGDRQRTKFAQVLYTCSLRLDTLSGTAEEERATCNLLIPDMYTIIAIFLYYNHDLRIYPVSTDKQTTENQRLKSSIADGQEALIDRWIEETIAPPRSSPTELAPS